MPELRAFRGGNPLTNEEFRSHLALASKLDNVGVLLGAGASLTVGGIRMNDIWREFANQYQESAIWLADQRFVPATAVTGTTTPNFEGLLDQIEIAIVEWRRQNANGRNLKKLIRHRNNLYRSVVRAAVLQSTLWEKPDSILRAPELRLHRQLLTRLVASRQPGQPAPWIFTTNYDLAVEWAAESLGVRVINGFAGLHYRSFASSNFDLGYRNMQGRGEARFGTYHVYLAKLHGSLTWMPAERFSVRELTSDVSVKTRPPMKGLHPLRQSS